MALALRIGPSPIGDSLPDEALRAAWREHRDRLLADEPRGSRPWAWWRFEPGIPERLRTHRPVLVKVDADEPAAGADDDRADVVRAAWLSERT